MQSKHFSLFAAIMLWCAIRLDLFAQPTYSPSGYDFQRFDMSDGLGSDYVNAVVQDSLGFIWMLHADGLSRYDGYGFKTYRYDPQDKNSMGPPLDGFLKLDQSNNPWIISYQAYEPDLKNTFTRYDRQKDGFVNYHPDLQGAIGSATSICFDKNRRVIWIGSWGRGLFRFDISTGETINYINMLKDSAVDLTRHSPWEQRNAIFGISDRDSVLLLTTWRGLWQFDKHTRTFSQPQVHPTDSSLLYNAPISSIIEPQTRNGICISVEDVGMIRLNNNLTEKAAILVLLCQCKISINQGVSYFCVSSFAKKNSPPARGLLKGGNKKYGKQTLTAMRHWLASRPTCPRT